MELFCDQCGNKVHVQGARPRDCPDCGAGLTPAKPPHDRSQNARLPVDPLADKTIPPTGFYQTQDQGFPRISGYEILRELGCGGMGRVFEARELESGRLVALKVLSGELAHHEPQVLERFVQEGRLAARISHPRSVFVYQAGFQGQRPFIAMELMPGRTLQDELQEVGKLSVQRAVDVTIDIIDGLLAAHHLGVVHRDVKPTNCFVERDGRVKIGDFGLSKSLQLDSELTRAGTFMGTPSFASPEQVRGEDVDARSDIYSLGATLYDLLSGRPPFVGDPIAVTAQIVSSEPPPLRSLNPQVPRGLEAIINQAMAKDVNERYQDLELMRSHLLSFASRGTSLAEMGRRVAAFMIDYGGLQLVFQGLMALSLFGIVFSENLGNGAVSEEGLKKMMRIPFWFGLANWIAALTYFGIGDGLRGATWGKKLLSLRVVNMRGERPGLGRGLLRALVIPGAFGVPLITLAVTRLWKEPQEYFAAESEFTIWVLDILPFAFLALLCLLTMRQETGSRGIHDWLSGTRLLHLSFARKRHIKKISTLPFQKLAEPYHLGRFKIVGSLSTNRDGKGVFLGWDDALDRKVIVFCDQERTALEVAGHHTSRATRNRWLQGGNEGALRWDAFEYFGGVPFSFLTNRMKDLCWADVKYALFDLVRELSAAVQDGSLPQHLSFDQFLISPEGRGRLIDLPVNVTGRLHFQSNRPIDERSDLQRADALLRDVLDWCHAHQLMPQSTNEMIVEFRRRPASLETLNWLRDSLDEENRKSSRLTWDERIGVMAFSAGIEWTVVAGVTSLLSWWVLSLVGYFPFWKTFWCWGAALMGVYLVGWLSRGGPAFRLMGVEIRRRNGKPAADWLCGVRTVLSWAGICAVATCSTYFLEFGNETMLESGNSDPAQSALVTNNPERMPAPANSQVSAPTDGEQELVTPSQLWRSDIQNNLWQILSMLGVIVVGLAISIAGAIFSVVNPERGLQDYLLGTRLLPK